MRATIRDGWSHGGGGGCDGCSRGGSDDGLVGGTSGGQRGGCDRAVHLGRSRTSAAAPIDTHRRVLDARYRPDTSYINSNRS